MPDRRTIVTASAVLAILLLAACGSSSGNGVASKTPDQIITRSTNAIEGVRSVRVSGSVSSGSSSTITLDLHLVAGKGATGSMSENGLSFQLLTVANSAYINGSPSFWRKFGGASAAKQLQGTWLKAPADTGDFASFSSLTNLHKLLSGLLSGHGALTKGAMTTIRGQKAIALKDTSKGGTLYVATTGPPYPIEIVNTGTNGGELTFSQINRPVTLVAPTRSIDISTLRK